MIADAGMLAGPTGGMGASGGGITSWRVGTGPVTVDGGLPGIGGGASGSLGSSASRFGIGLSGSISVGSISIFASPIPVGFSSHSTASSALLLETDMTGLPLFGFSAAAGAGGFSGGGAAGIFCGSDHPASGSSWIDQLPVGGP